MTDFVQNAAEICSIAGSIAALVSPAVVFAVRFFRNLSKRLERLEMQNKAQQLDIESSLEERRMLLEGVYACLDGLHQQGCNGRVTAALKALDEYLISAAHRTSGEEPND